MAKTNGGFWGFIKKLFGFGKDDERQSSYTIVADEVVDAELDDTHKFDADKARREAEEMIAKSFEDEKVDPDEPDVFFSRATGYSILGDNRKALELLDKTLSLDADYADAYRLKASIYNDAENYRAVIENLDRAISLHSEEPEDDLSEYFPSINETLSRLNKRERADDYQNRAEANYSLNNFEAAIDDFTKAIEIDSESDFLFSSRGEAYLESGNPAKALEDLNRAIEIRGDYYNYGKRAKIYRELGYLDAALQDLSKAIALSESGNPEHARYFDGYLERAEIHMEKGDYDSAVEDLTAQIEKDPEYIDPYEKRAAARRHLGMESLAEADEQKAAELIAEYEAAESEETQQAL